MSWTQRFIDDLVGDGGRVRPGDAPDEYIIEAYRGRDLPHPVTLRMDPVALERYVRWASESSADVYPGVDPLEGGYRLTSIHFDETIDALRPVREMWFEEDEIGSTPLEGWVDPIDTIPPGDYRWSTTRPEA